METLQEESVSKRGYIPMEWPIYADKLSTDVDNFIPKCGKVP